MATRLTWDDRYRNGEHRNLAPASLVAQAIEKLPPGRALDLACGAGRHAFVLAEQGWRVTAVDASRVAIDLVRERARERHLEVDARLADLEKHEFDIQPDAFDLICDCCYLQRDLFPAIRTGVRPGGIMIAIIHLVDPSPDVKPMNPEFLLCPGELRGLFAGWEILHDFEGKPAGAPHERSVVEIVARRPIAGEYGRAEADVYF
jgi:tellurite methyltransferase